MLCVHEISWTRPQNKAEDTQLCWNYCADSNKKLKDATEMWTPFVLCYFSFPPSLHVYADECRQILGCLAQILVSFWLALLLSHCHWAHSLGIDAWVSRPQRCAGGVRSSHTASLCKGGKVLQCFEVHKAGMERSSFGTHRQGWCVYIALVTPAVPHGILCSQTQHLFPQNQQQSSSMKSKNCVWEGIWVKQKLRTTGDRMETFLEIAL